jgi:hypothetical protein
MCELLKCSIYGVLNSQRDLGHAPVARVVVHAAVLETPDYTRELAVHGNIKALTADA